MEKYPPCARAVSVPSICSERVGRCIQRVRLRHRGAELLEAAAQLPRVIRDAVAPPPHAVHDCAATETAPPQQLLDDVHVGALLLPLQLQNGRTSQ
eukprot:SAG25_NODE_2943_length_1305_cov_0.807629_1_plen_96_part_00